VVIAIDAEANEACVWVHLKVYIGFATGQVFVNIGNK
jgi:hypothetical protein